MSILIGIIKWTFFMTFLGGVFFLCFIIGGGLALFVLYIIFKIFESIIIGILATLMMIKEFLLSIFEK